MAELKTKPTAVRVEDFINAVPNAQKREDSFTLIKMMKEITGEKPRMWGPSIVGFGEYHYVYASGHEGDACVAGFSPRKAAITVYCMCAQAHPRTAALVKKLGKAKASKGCLYIKKLADVDLAVLRQLIEANIAQVQDLVKAGSKRKSKPAKKR